MTDNTVEKFDGIKESHKNPPLYFTILFYGLILWGVLFSAYYLFSGWSSSAEFQQKMDNHRSQFNTAPQTLDLRQR